MNANVGNKGVFRAAQFLQDLQLKLALVFCDKFLTWTYIDDTLIVGAMLRSLSLKSATFLI